MAWKDGKFTQSPWSKLDNMALSLLRKILAPLPSSRSTIEQIKTHRWLSHKQTKHGKIGIALNGSCTQFLVTCVSFFPLPPLFFSLFEAAADI
jgi:prenyltransferase beta subunit